MDTRLRMRMFAFVVLALFGGLMARLWYLQGIESTREEFQERALTNVLEPVYEEAPRGRILDRNGRVLVDNKVVQVVAIDRAVVEDLEISDGVRARMAATEQELKEERAAVSDLLGG